MAPRTLLSVVAHHRPNSIAAFAFGAVFVAAGLGGFGVSVGHHAVGPAGGLLLGVFQVNVLHNMVHVVVGAVMIAAGIVGSRSAKAVNAALGLGYLALFVIGLFLVGSSANVIALNGADNALHLVLGAALTAIGMVADRDLR
ncbi:MAG TPA: DUF4383 domain-containing protein [Catenuloplanes sp.]|jgi:hypothetical protein